jgi:hypothetical protein
MKPTTKQPTKPKPTTKPRVKVTYANCELFATFAMICPLCRVMIPAGTPHRCRRAE